MRGQMRSDAVSLTAYGALTSVYIRNQVRYSNVLRGSGRRGHRFKSGYSGQFSRYGMLLHISTNQKIVDLWAATLRCRYIVLVERCLGRRGRNTRGDRRPDRGQFR
jgi:hypothetical protein